MQPLVSIITPCLNSVSTIERTVLSVLNQSYKNIQYIIVDGKSSDGTFNTLVKYQKLDNRIVLISEKDNSMTEALNTGLRLSDGDIIASINSDDWYELETISYVVEIFQRKSFDCLMGNTKLVSEELGTPLYITKPWLASWVPAWYMMGCFTPECSVFYSSLCIKEVGYFDESLKYTQDFDYYLRILKKFNILYVNKILSNFSVSPNQYSSRLLDEMESEVQSYINYKNLREILGGTSIGSVLRVFLGMRIYSLKQFVSHLYSFAMKNFLGRC